MADMSTKNSSKRIPLSTEQIDDLVVFQSEDDTAWDAPIEVRRTKPGFFPLPPELAERAMFLARVHHAADVEEWLATVIRERIELEEFAFTSAKREMRTKEKKTQGRLKTKKIAEPGA